MKHTLKNTRSRSEVTRKTRTDHKHRAGEQPRTLTPAGRASRRASRAINDTRNRIFEYLQVGGQAIVAKRAINPGTAINDDRVTTRSQYKSQIQQEIDDTRAALTFAARAAYDAQIDLLQIDTTLLTEEKIQELHEVAYAIIPYFHVS